MDVIPVSNDNVRASDQDREGAVAILCDAYAAGRLGLADVRDRAGAAYQARTWGDLRRLTADLPLHQASSPASTRPRRATGVRQPPRRSRAPILLVVLASLAMAAAALIPLAAVPLAALPLLAISLSALFAAGLSISSWDPEVTVGMNIYKFQALVTLCDGDDSPRRKLVSAPRRMMLRSRNVQAGPGQIFDALVSCDDDAPLRPGSRQLLVTLRLAGRYVEDYLGVGDRFDLRLGGDVGRGVIIRRLVT